MMIERDVDSIELFRNSCTDENWMKAKDSSTRNIKYFVGK